jgi:hypothetical protein
MAGSRGRRVARVAVVALALPLLISALALVLVKLTVPATMGVAVLLGATVLYGMVVNRWWVCVLPLAWWPLLAIQTWGSEESPVFIFVLTVVPLTAALLVGVGLHRVGSLIRRRRNQTSAVSS